MKRSIPQQVYSFLVKAQQWYLDTPERSLEEAYKAALLIKAMEDEHFNGQKIAPGASYGGSAIAYFQSELQKHLKTIRMRLTEFKASRSWINPDYQNITKITKSDGTVTGKDSFAIQKRDNQSRILEKLRFIDDILAKYDPEATVDSVVVTESPSVSSDLARSEQIAPNGVVKNVSPAKKTKTKAETTSVLPRSILSTINRLKVELDPRAEDEVVNKFRNSQRRTFVSIRLILLLIIVPFLTQQLSKNLIISPIVDHFRNSQEVVIFLNSEMEERALIEMQRFEEQLKFRNLLNEEMQLSPLQIEQQMHEKVRDLVENFRQESSNAVKNVFADLLSVGAFTWLIVTSRKELEVLKEFMDNVVYGLSDSAKAFIIILFTDIFVGFHSTHGWEVLLGTASRHFGLPENRDFIFLFIATFPVILDAVFKYWIFRYLNRISPSAVATYRNMNE
ncbi:proton extrusion protein PcxA [Gloeocapsopsis dulcis]|uniref:Proton extrusion protein PxcA n=1 Tax=Gloeocapsopsis dulcis AAB1 = 1H9 TaxID=1433147 RepID=A0A6N8FRJ6_9CHRO|nr:proton extrusion protein PcxA [Gloeocapsopsis dulcis]MUL34965.1 proton extrusion protein PcxA [Gloeocapsopsis dulcis AAB1 = 1H9]WNN89963.1 proton extrusion protein PcxA [Gloeocapsopsis dulcis]